MEHLTFLGLDIFLGLIAPAFLLANFSTFSGGGKHGNGLLSTQTTSLLTHKPACKLVFVCIYECCFMFRKRVLKMFHICLVFIVLCQLILPYTSMKDRRNESKFFFSVGVVFFVRVNRCLEVYEECNTPVLSLANCCT